MDRNQDLLKLPDVGKVGGKVNDESATEEFDFLELHCSKETLL
jgi:hypothetical protein